MKNLVILIGRIASQPETRHAGETAITSFTLVTDRPKLVDGKTVKNEAGYTETLAEFHRVTAFNGLGTSVAKHKKKGDLVEVQGVELRFDPLRHGGFSAAQAGNAHQRLGKLDQSTVVHLGSVRSLLSIAECLVFCQA